MEKIGSALAFGSKDHVSKPGGGKKMSSFVLSSDLMIAVYLRSSILVLYFLLHAAYFFSTWMTSCVHLKNRGLVIWD